MSYISVELIGDYLTLGSVGFLGGVLLPFGFRLIGYVIDSARAIVEF